jgi:hypothetical protein
MLILAHGGLWSAMDVRGLVRVCPPLVVALLYLQPVRQCGKQPGCTWETKSRCSENGCPRGMLALVLITSSFMMVVNLLRQAASLLPKRTKPNPNEPNWTHSIQCSKLAGQPEMPLPRKVSRSLARSVKVLARSDLIEVLRFVKLVLNFGRPIFLFTVITA